MFNTPVSLMSLPPLFCLAKKFHYISCRAVYFKASSHVNMFVSLSLARTTQYCLLIRTLTYYVISNKYGSRANFFTVYLLNIFNVLFYKIKHYNIMNCFITIYCNGTYSIIDHIPHGP